MKKTTLATLAGLAGYTIFGFSFLFSKVALELTEPFALLAYRFIVAFIIVNLLVLFRLVPFSLKGKPVGKLLVMGFVLPVFYFVVEAYGIALTTSSYAGIILSLTPVAGLFLGRLLLGERASVFQMCCTVVSIVGVVMTSTGGLERVSVLGTVLLVSSAVSTALFNTISRSVSEIFTPFERTYVMFALGSAVFTVMALVRYRHDMAALLAPAGVPMFWVAVLYLAAVSSVGAFMLVNYAVSYLPVSRVTIFNNFSSVVSVLAGVLIMHDSFTLTQFAGIVVILVGVFGVSWQRGGQ